MTTATTRTPDLYASVVSPTRYGSDDTTYVRAGLYLSGPGLVEDWGCGTTYARRFIGAPYRGVDGLWSRFADEQADLAVPRQPVPKILMRHVLEHNWNWREILVNMLASFTDRAVLILFLRPGEKDRNVSASDLSDESEWPGLELCEADLLAILAQSGVSFSSEEMETATAPYNYERIYWLAKGGGA
jgi:hypothetical protein